jgi:hypothetical protein
MDEFVSLDRWSLSVVVSRFTRVKVILTWNESACTRSGDFAELFSKYVGGIEGRRT